MHMIFHMLFVEAEEAAWQMIPWNDDLTVYNTKEWLASTVSVSKVCRKIISWLRSIYID